MRFVLTADWHIRATKPRCRIDEDWIQTQRLALNQIADIANSNDCPVYVVGDLFHSHGDTNFEVVQLIQEFANSLNHGMFILAGNHDLPHHNSSNLHKSAIGILLHCEKINFIQNNEYVSAGNFDQETENKEIIFKHILCFPDLKSMPPNVNAATAEDLLDEYDNAKWIFTGDYHHNFVYENKGRHVVNSGCLIRQVSDMKDYQCGVYVIDTDLNKIDFVPIVDDYDLVDDSHILRQNEKDERIENMVDKLMDIEAVSLDFIQNIENVLLKTDVSDEIRKCVKELIYDV